MTIVVSLICGTVLFEPPPVANGSMHPQPPKIVPFTFPGMPLQINTAGAERLTVSFWLNYSVTNTTHEQIDSFNFSILKVNSENKISSLIEAFSAKPIAPGARQENRIFINRELEPDEYALIAVTKAVGRSGTWTIDGRALTKVIRSRLTKQDADEAAKYETHAVVTDEDRREILGLILNGILKDEKKSSFLPDRSRPILLREGPDINFPSLKDTSIVALNMDEIQEAADARGRIVYLIYRPLEIEGARVFARIAVRESVRRNSKAMGIPFKYMFVFVCTKKDGRWRIEESLGYS